MLLVSVLFSSQREMMQFGSLGENGLMTVDERDQKKERKKKKDEKKVLFKERSSFFIVKLSVFLSNSKHGVSFNFHPQEI